MSGTGATGHAAGAVPPPLADGLAVRGRHGSRRWVGAGAVVVVAAAVVALAVTDPFRAAAAGGLGSDEYHTGTATVTLRSLSSQMQVDATLADAGSYSVVNQAAGTITALPAAGQVVRQDQVLYQVSGASVVLLYGGVPAWRELAEGVTGPDVAELNADLVTLGCATAAALGPSPGWDYFSAETGDALQALQARLGLTVTGTLPLGQAVFLPGPALITGLGAGVVPGGPAVPGTVLATASSTTPVVTVDLDPALQTEVRDGDQVSVTLPDGASTPGVVSSVSTVASAPAPGSASGSGSGSSSGNSAGSGGSGSSATITVQVALRDPAAAESLNQAPVMVTITTGSVSNVLVVPVDALLAQPGGGYAVEVTGPHGERLVAVSPGLFDDAAGLVQVTGSGLAPGQRVVVPAT